MGFSIPGIGGIPNPLDAAKGLFKAAEVLFEDVEHGIEALIKFMSQLAEFLVKLTKNVEDFIMMTIKLGELTLIVAPGMAILFYGSQVIQRFTADDDE